jgi:hypothetical protein
MDKERRKQLKREGKRMVEEYSQQVRDRLHDENPFHYTDPRWAENYKEVHHKNAEYQANGDTIYKESELDGKARIEVVPITSKEKFPPYPGWYIRCNRCRSILPTVATRILSCECGLIHIDPNQRFRELPNPESFEVVTLKAKGSIRNTAPWWMFWKKS